MGLGSSSCSSSSSSSSAYNLRARAESPNSCKDITGDYLFVRTSPEPRTRWLQHQAPVSEESDQPARASEISIETPPVIIMTMRRIFMTRNLQNTSVSHYREGRIQCLQRKVSMSVGDRGAAQVWSFYKQGQFYQDIYPHNKVCNES